MGIGTGIVSPCICAKWNRVPATIDSGPNNITGVYNRCNPLVENRTPDYVADYLLNAIFIKNREVFSSFRYLCLRQVARRPEDADA